TTGGPEATSGAPARDTGRLPGGRPAARHRTRTHDGGARMTPMPDLTPAARRMAALLAGVRDHRLAALAAAWRSPDAWQGMTQAGGVDLPGEAAGHVALNELVVHGWDVARASGQPYDPGEDEIGGCLAFVAPTVEQSGGKGVEGLFGPAVDVPADAPALHRLLGLT